MIHKTTRSILSVLLAALLLVTSIPLTPAFADGGAVSPQSESAEGRVLAGSGTESDPYKIATANDLREFAKLVNDDKTDADAILTANIDLNPNMEINEDGTVTGNPDQWIPIGTSIGNPYEGNFNGDGHTISGLYIDSSRADYQGLFGSVGSSGKIENLSVSGTVSGNNYVGGVVGLNGGSVEDCDFTGSVSGNYVGGVVGYSSGISSASASASVTNCYNTGEVSGGEDVGGVVGNNSFNATVTNCYNTGKVSGSGSGSNVGGVVGYNDSGTVENSYNTGKVSGPDSGTSNYVGGVVGYNISSVTNCYFLQGTAGSGIGSGKPSEENVKSLTAEEFADQSKFSSWTDFTNTWKIEPIFGRPTLQANAEIGGTANNPYKIFTATQLKTFRDLVNRGGAGASAHAKLMNNINLSSVCGENAGELGQSVSWIPIGSIIKPYSGTFDGNGKTISGLYINNSTADYQGLFCYVGSSGKVQNLSVSGSVSGDRYVGGVVGLNRGTVENCYNTGSVSGPDSVNGETTVNVGGVVGYNISGSVENCYNTGSVSGSGNSVGGVVGENSGSVKNCYNTGSVSDGTYTGGVVGYNSGGSVTGCYFLQGTADVNENLSGIGEGSGTASDVEPKTAKDFHSGEVAYLLQSKQTDESGLVWGQNIKDGKKDNYPQLRAFDADTPQVYKVAFMNDSEEHDAKYANSGMTVTPPEAPNKTDHLFGGWFNNGELTGDPVTGSISVTGNATYTAKWTPFSYTLSATPDTLNFGSITEGEERPAAQNVTITNTGNQRVPLVQPTAENFEIGALSKTELAPGETATFTVQPKDKLPRGSYSEQITITGDNNVSETLTATFTVKEPPYTGKYSYELSTSVGDHGSLSVDRYATEGEKVTITVTPDEAYKLDELVVTANGKDVELTANSDGTYTFTMPSADVRITATFAEDPDWSEPEEPTTDVSDLFIDIAPDAWYKDAVQYAYDNGLMTGVSANEFAPEQTTTRAMIVSILARLENVTTAEAAGFADVDDNDWYATAVNWAANVGVVNGYEDNTFRPNTAITREQLAAILMNYAAYKGEDVSNRADLTSYTDQPSTWAEEAMSWAVAEGLISGVTADTLQPQGAATRAQVAAILERFLAQ